MLWMEYWQKVMDNQTNKQNTKTDAGVLLIGTLSKTVEYVE